MSITVEIAERLMAAPTRFAHVGVATDLTEVMKKPPTAGPAGYVIVTREASADNSRATGPVMQRNERDVMVVLIVKNVGNRVGGPVVDPLEDIKSFTRGRLLGWVPNSATDPLTHVEGVIDQAEHGWVWFQDTFSAPTYLTETTAHEPTPEEDP